MDPQQYLVGGRSFGTLFLWVLLAGEIYTSFTFLGAAGWAYGFGAPAYYILGVRNVRIRHRLLSAAGRSGRSPKTRNLLTAPGLLRRPLPQPRAGRRRSACCSFSCSFRTSRCSFPGLQHLLTIAGYGVVNCDRAVGVAFIADRLFVFTAGLRGTAWASIGKDALVLGAVIFAGIAIPIAFFGSPAAMFDQLLKAHPHMLTLLPG